ncbi:MAG: type III-A CRISPR-associated RAMP protein Csm5 [Peptococcaceae bacterium]
MKTLGHLKSYDIQLTVQSPLFIGSGEKLSKKEYLFLPQENKAIIMDTEKLIVFLSRKNLLEKYQNFLLDNTQKNIYSFFRKNDITSNDYKYFSSYTIQCRENKPEDLQLFVKDAQGNAYIPGSSLKGAFRTAWLAYLLENESTNTKNNRTRQWLENIEACKNKYDSRKIENDLKRTTLQTANELEAKYFNTLNVNQRDTRNMVNSVMRGISFSDSTPINSSQLMLSQKIDTDVSGNEHRLPILRECLKPATTCRFTLTLDEIMLRDTGIDIEQILHIMQWFCRYQVDHFYKKFKGRVKLPVHSRETILWLGGGVGFQNKTINEPALGESNGVAYTSEVLDIIFKNHHHDKDIKKGVSPHMVKIATYQNVQYLMGQCKLEVIADK